MDILAELVVVVEVCSGARRVEAGGVAGSLAGDVEVVDAACGGAACCEVCDVPDEWVGRGLAAWGGA